MEIRCLKIDFVYLGTELDSRVLATLHSETPPFKQKTIQSSHMPFCNVPYIDILNLYGVLAPTQQQYVYVIV